MMIVKGIVKKFVVWFIDGINKTKIGGFAVNHVATSVMRLTSPVLHNGVKLVFATPNTQNRWRVSTFSDKEPETLQWIDSIPEESIVWDVGANIGLYSCYAAKARRCRIIAFEPSVFNLELLARNIFLNNLVEWVTIFPLPLFDRKAIETMRMTSVEWGGALSTFGKDFGWDGLEIQKIFEFSTVGICMDDVVTDFQIPQPHFIKMDVDGLEHFILKGGMTVLKQVKGILIEVNDDFHEQSEQCQRLLEEAGLVIKDKRCSEMIANAAMGSAKAFNQIWERP
ncbi:MAG: FkbM family methyltransferase [Magnetococcales bacterium]|nr:FkbM family methyltransferase [Magnetococcales bacterium]